MKSIDEIKIPGGKIISASRIDGVFTDGDFSVDGLPPMYRIIIETYPGKSSVVRHQVWLPDNWNGIFLGIGNGGFAGRLGTSLYIEASEGYAVAQTDMGTSALRTDEWPEDTSDMWIDYGWRATEDMTVVAKSVIEQYYGRAPEYSYFRGGSAGGKQALSLAQRMPTAYDGILATVPSNNAPGLTVYFLWCHLTLSDENNQPLFTDEEKEEIYSVVLEFFKNEGQADDGYIDYGWCGEDTVERVMAFIKEKKPELTERQLEALKAMYDGPRHKITGKRLYSGVPFGAEINCGYFGSGAGDFDFPWFKLFFGKEYNNRDFDFGKDYDAYRGAVGGHLGANDPDLSAFKAHGGKLIVYSGGADPYGPWPDAVKYYNRVCAEMGGFDNVKDFYRYFILPGRDHGNEGLGINTVFGDDGHKDMVKVLREWREGGIAPASLHGEHIERTLDTEGKVISENCTFTKALYPYEANLAEGKDFPYCIDDEYLR